MFTHLSFQFLRELAAHNERAWFEPRKAEFQRLCRDPALVLVEALRAPLAAISPHFEADSRPVGGSLFRIYRDVRFSKDKSPYKPWLGLRLRHQAEKQRFEAPLFYVHLGPEGCFAGGGLWHPSSPVLGRVRAFMVDNPASLQAVLEDAEFRTRFRRGGDSTVRMPRGFDPAHPLAEELRRKDFVAMADFSEADACGPALVDVIVQRLRGAAPLVDYLCAGLDLPF